MSLLKPKFITRLFDPPLRFGGGLILNILGYHFLRILFFQLSYAFKKRKPLKDQRGRAILEEIMIDGIAVIPNFFPDDVFEKLKAECEALELPVTNERAPRILRSNVVGDDIETAAPLLESHLAKNELINNIVSSAMRQEVITIPTVTVEKTWFSVEDIGKDSTDKSDNLHFDVSYPTIKCFMYLNEVNEQNAAFRFVRKSHRMTPARAWMEYKMSVPFWLWSKEKQLTYTPEVSSSWVKNQGLIVESINGGPNTLIIANTMGLHRKGDYRSTIPREMVFVNYRGLTDAVAIKKKIKSLIKSLKPGAPSLPPPPNPLKY